MKKTILLVDDNDKYAKLIQEYFEQRGYRLERAYSGKDGLNKLQNFDIDYFDMIITDITMESQLAGLNFLKEARKLGFTGKIIIASTGLNYSIVLYLAPIFLNSLKVDYLIPKDSILKKDFKFYENKIFPTQKSKIEF
ncbi:MAG: response regulator [Leptospiraceae bacterium]|nr:response regulator [Leptospiraceae bacterium]MDW7975815.1 response regulator [Leptospiraceae bacterium]